MTNLLVGLREDELTALEGAANRAGLSTEEYARHAITKAVLLSALGKRVHIGDLDVVTLQDQKDPPP